MLYFIKANGRLLTQPYTNYNDACDAMIELGHKTGAWLEIVDESDLKREEEAVKNSNNHSTIIHQGSSEGSSIGTILFLIFYFVALLVHFLS